MRPTRQLEEGPGVFDLMEEGFHLLRSAPATILVAYYAGTIPFVLGLLYFWSDMSQSAFARERLGVASLGIALLFFWAKFWQALFARRLLMQRSGQAGEPIAALGKGSRPPFAVVAGGFNLFCVQAVIHATGLFLWPLALLLLLPFGWVNAFYQSATALGVGATGSLKATIQEAAGQAKLWVLHNHVFLLVWKAFWMFVLLNWISAALALPFLARTFLGVETPFTKSPAAMMNSTFFAVVTALLYLSTDPLHKAVYVLRCFYGRSLRTGRDLSAELAEFTDAARLRRATALALLVAAVSWSAPAAGAAAAPTNADASEARSVSPRELNHSIHKVLQQPEYSWRLPRPEREREVGLIEGFVANIGNTLASVVKAAGRWLGRVMDRINRFLRPRGPMGSGAGWVVALRTIVFVLLVLLLFLVCGWLFRLWQQRRRPRDDAPTPARQFPPDLTDHNIGADQLPEDEWVALGRDLWKRGELRLAMRAFYLASLAHLAERKLIALAKHKSNYDYARELRRRAHALPAVAQLFDENVSVFDRSWYGLHRIEPAAMERFASNVDRMKAG